MQRVAINEAGLRIGEDHQNAKLTNAEVDQIRSLNESGISYRHLAKMFEVSKITIAMIIRCERRAQPPRVIWKCVRQRAGLWQDRADRLDQVVLHTTRHSAVTKMLKGGANLTQAAVVSGHQTLAMLKRYEHLAAQDAVELAQRLLGGSDSKTA